MEIKVVKCKHQNLWIHVFLVFDGRVWKRIPMGRHFSKKTRMLNKSYEKVHFTEQWFKNPENIFKLMIVKPSVIYFWQLDDVMFFEKMKL